MDWTLYNTPLSLRDIQITDPFWKNEMELVRKEVLPYQWAALNDQVEGAAPSYCMRNFKIAGKLNRRKAEEGDKFKEPTYTFRGFEALPEDPANPGDHFYGFVFQDSDFHKWIEAVAYSLTQHPDPELEKTADSAIDLVCAAQQEDGYLDTYYIINGRDKTFSNLRDHHELYCFGHLVEGAVAYYQATGKKKLLNAAERFADYIADYFGAEEGKCKGYPGHEIAEMALVRLYETTGEQKYLNLSRFFIDQRGTMPYYFDQEHPEEIKPGQEHDLRYFYHQAHLPVREQDEAVGHAVRAVYLYSGMADIARLTQDEELYQACERLWNNIVTKKMYITGGIGSTHIREAFSYAYDLPNDTAYAETCASIGLVFFARRMLQIRPQAKYADVMERALYNGILSGMALDGKSFFYVNPLEVNPEACRKDERKSHVKPMRQKWFGCACCPPNLARLLSSIASYAYTETENTLYIHLYIGCSITKTIIVPVDDSEKQLKQKIQISIESAFPWEGSVKIQVHADCPTHSNALHAGRRSGQWFQLALRIPGWIGEVTDAEQVCRRCHITGIEKSKITFRDGYLYIAKDWEETDFLELHFPMEVQLMEADARVKEDIGKVAVTRGPVVYCLEEADNGKDLHLLTLDPLASPSVSDISICQNPAKAVIWPGFRQRTIEESTPIQPAPDDGLITSASLYHCWKKKEKEAVSLHFIPYYMWANRSAQDDDLDGAGGELAVWVRTEMY